MKNKFQSFVYLLFVIGTFWLLATIVSVYENPFDWYENPLVWVVLGAFVTVLLLKEYVHLMALEKAKELLPGKRRHRSCKYRTRMQQLKNGLKNGPAAKDISEEDDIVLDHNYDGIKELDNALPPWWVYMFYATIVFAVVYLFKYEVFDGDTQIMEYEKEVAAAQVQHKQYNKDVPAATGGPLVLLTDAASLSRGKAVFNLNCASCHAADGGGGIGPNLTDAHWILGGGVENIYATIADGGRDGEGNDFLG